MTRVSVVIPAFDAAATIGNTLTALAGQRGIDGALEVIVVDDGSSDRTAEIARASAATRVVQQANAGPGAARNAGVAAATGEVVLFTDSDCIPDAGWVVAMLRAFEDDSVALVMGQTHTEAGDGYLALAKRGSDRVADRPGPVTRFNSNNLGLRSWLARALPFDEALRIYGEDTDLGWRVLEQGHRTLYAPDARVEHRHRHDGRSFLRDGWLQGIGAARLHYKHRRPVPRDLAPALAGLALLALGALPVGGSGLSGAGAALCFAAFAAALLWNELRYKANPLGIALATLPAQLAWYACKLAGYLTQRGRIAGGAERELVRSRHELAARPQPSPRGEL